MVEVLAKIDIPEQRFSTELERMFDLPGKGELVITLSGDGDINLAVYNDMGQIVAEKNLLTMVVIREGQRLLREKVAEELHDIWVRTTKNLAEEEEISPQRITRWKKYWGDYSTLPEAVKDLDRHLATTMLRNLKLSTDISSRDPKQSLLSIAEQSFL